MLSDRQIPGIISVQICHKDHEEKKLWLEKTCNLRTIKDPNTRFKLTTEILLINPEYYQAWNVRKYLLINSPNLLNIKEELEFNVETIKVNPKSYGAWYHRQWIFITFIKSHDSFDPKHELFLIDVLLNLDSRNFHGWNYRVFICKHFNIKDDSRFALEKIYQNFSNYSAWHRRSKVIDPISVRESDLKLLRSAYYTAPEDQSAWFYLTWILKDADRETILKEMNCIEELLSIEPQSPLAYDTWINLAIKTKIDVNVIREKLETWKSCDHFRIGLLKYYEDQIENLSCLINK